MMQKTFLEPYFTEGYIPLGVEAVWATGDPPPRGWIKTSKNVILFEPVSPMDVFGLISASIVEGLGDMFPVFEAFEEINYTQGELMSIRNYYMLGTDDFVHVAMRELEACINNTERFLQEYERFTIFVLGGDLEEIKTTSETLILKGHKVNNSRGQQSRLIQTGIDFKSIHDAHALFLLEDHADSLVSNVGLTGAEIEGKLIIHSLRSDTDFIGRLKKVIYEVLNLPFVDLMGGRKKAALFRARAIFSLLCKIEGYTYRQIGVELNLGHPAVIYQITRARDLLKHDAEFKAAHNKIKSLMAMPKI